MVYPTYLPLNFPKKHLSVREYIINKTPLPVMFGTVGSLLRRNKLAKSSTSYNPLLNCNGDHC